MLGAAESTRDSLECALQVAREQRNLPRIEGVLQGLVTALAELGELERAGALLEEMRRIHLELEPTGSPLDHAWLITAASVAVNEGQHLRTARLVGATRCQAGDPDGGSPVARALVQRFAQKSIRALGDGWDRAVGEGYRLEIEEILAAPEPSARRQPDDLSAREFEVISLVTDGLTDAEIAERLGIRPRTVSTHLTSVYNKFGVRSRTEALREAQKRGLLETV